MKQTRFSENYLPWINLFNVIVLCSGAAVWGHTDDSTGPTQVPSSEEWFVRPQDLAVVYGDPALARLSFAGDFFYGPIKGFVQTPAGGTPGSTSQRRPRLGELGIHDAAVGTGTVAFTWGPHEIFGGAEIVRLSGSDILRSDLVSHATSFAAGTDVNGDVTLDTYRVGYRRHFSFFSADNDQPQLSLAPYADALFWNFDYTITGGGSRASRGYLKPTVQLGIDARWCPCGGRFSLGADLSASPPGVSSIPFVAAEQLTARYRFIDSYPFALTGLLGVRLEQMNYFDTQRVPNHIRADLGPLGVLGFEIRF